MFIFPAFLAASDGGNHEKADQMVSPRTAPRYRSVEAPAFYSSLERLLAAYGEDQAFWPDSEDRRIVESFLREKDALTLNNCIFGKNLLGLGMGESAKDAEKAMRGGAVDAWGNPYSLIVAGSRDAPKLFEIMFAIGVNRGAPFFNKDICQKVFVFLKADFHSMFADVFKNFNGDSVLFMAREIHLIGAPGSVEAGYPEKLKPALCAADNLYATIYIGDNDPVTAVIPKSFRDKVYAMFGLVIPKFRGTQRVWDDCRHQEFSVVNVFRLTGCGHDLPEYYPLMQKFGKTHLKAN